MVDGIESMRRCEELAVRVLREHDDHSSGWCPVCVTPWPCARVLLADNNLTLTS